MTATPSDDFIAFICVLYADRYDDRIEDTSPPARGINQNDPTEGGRDWAPGQEGNHRSLADFRRLLREEKGINLSTVKIRKILMTGGCWSTRRSRMVAESYAELKSIKAVAERLGITEELVCLYLPYQKCVYSLEQKSGNARRIERWRKARRAGEGETT